MLGLQINQSVAEACSRTAALSFIITPSSSEHTHTHNAVINRSSFRAVYDNNSQNSNLQVLRKFRLVNPRNYLKGYLKINSLMNKITDVREMIGSLQLDYFVISETKLDSNFPSAQFHIGVYEIRNRRDRDKRGGGLNEFVKKGITAKRIKDLETNLSKAICTEITLSKKGGFAGACTDHHLLQTLILFLMS